MSHTMECRECSEGEESCVLSASKDASGVLVFAWDRRMVAGNGVNWGYMNRESTSNPYWLIQLPTDLLIDPFLLIGSFQLVILR